MKQATKFLARAARVMAGNGFFWFICGLLVFQAIWIAVSGLYPMAFDEDFHLGIITLYAHHVSPFWSGQPAHAEMYGAVARDPSYLYHYLMSFPYRVISYFIKSQTTQVIILRFINIGLFTAGLYVFRQLLRRTKASDGVINFCLLIFVLIPVVPFLAAQINYDNLLIPATGLCLLLSVRFCQELADKRQINGRLLIQLVALCLLTSLIKYAFLPILIVIFVFSFWQAYRVFGKKLWGALIKSLRRSLSIGLVLLLLLSLVMFVERYGLNVVRYHTPTPSCNKVLSIKECSHYGPWIRDYNFSINKVDEEKNPLVYIGDWFYGMWLRMFFAVNGPASNYATDGPFVVPAVGVIVWAGLGLILVIKYWKIIFTRYDSMSLKLLLWATAFYTLVLWLDEYRSYLHTGQPVAINGRYLFPVLLFVIFLFVLAYEQFLRRHDGIKLGIAALAILCMLWGGGALTYILRSDNSWYWNNQTVRDANQFVKQSVGPVTPGYTTPNQFLH